MKWTIDVRGTVKIKHPAQFMTLDAVAWDNKKDVLKLKKRNNVGATTRSWGVMFYYDKVIYPDRSYVWTLNSTLSYTDKKVQ